MPVVQLTNPETWEHIFFNVKGRHAEDIAAQMNDGTLAQSIETGGAGARSVAQTGDETKLTKQEENLATKFGISTEEFVKQKKSIGANPLGVNINV